MSNTGLAFDDQTSTFIIPSGGGFEVVFCPTGRSSTILKVYKQELTQLAQSGSVSAQVLADTRNVTLMKQRQGAGVKLSMSDNVLWSLALIAALILCT